MSPSTFSINDFRPRLEKRKEKKPPPTTPSPCCPPPHHHPVPPPLPPGAGALALGPCTPAASYRSSGPGQGRGGHSRRLGRRGRCDGSCSERRRRRAAAKGCCCCCCCQCSCCSLCLSLSLFTAPPRPLPTILRSSGSLVGRRTQPWGPSLADFVSARRPASPSPFSFSAANVSLAAAQRAHHAPDTQRAAPAISSGWSSLATAVSEEEEVTAAVVVAAPTLVVF